jgi:hypothetical protein
MIILSGDQLICARHGGGMHMSNRLSSRDVQVTPAQVWPALSSELRTRIVGLLAQLALNVVHPHSDNAGPMQEVTSDDKNPLSKNSFRSS